MLRSRPASLRSAELASRLTPHASRFLLPPAACSLLAAAAVLVSLSGCGSATYETRLAETSKYFGYLNMLNRELSRTAWDEAGVSIRLPKEFDSVPEPPAEDQDAAERRHPSFFGQAAPGIAGAFVADVSAESGTEPCRLYVLSNYNLWASETAKLAPDFQNLVLHQMTSSFGLPEMDAGALKSVQIPIKATYVDRQTFGTATLHPQ
jgi:hypothetical protein